MKKTTFAALVVCFALASCLPASALTPTHLTPDTSHLTLDTSHLTPDTSHLTPSPTPAPPTETPAPTATADTLSLPANFPEEFKAQIGDAKWEQRDDGHIWVANADGQYHDWFEMKSDGSEYRYSDAKLIASAPNQQEWWGAGETRGNEPARRIFIVFPEPENQVHLQITSSNGTNYEIIGIRGVIPDKNDSNVIHEVIVPIEAWADTSLFWTMEGRCPNLGCEQGFKPDVQYKGQFTRHLSGENPYPIPQHIIQINNAQQFNELIGKMLYNKEINNWPTNLVLFIDRFESEFPLLIN